MSTQAYRDWMRAGQPWRLAQPVREMKAALVGTFGQDAIPHLGTIGRRETHLAVEFPQDHAPFSETPWPVPLPDYVVCALDIMHRPDVGLDCDRIFDSFLVQARAGQMPWLKYLIWQAKLYDVRNDWQPQANSGHYDHIHLSVRSDWVDRSIGDWTPLGGIMDWSDNIAPKGEDSYSAGGALWVAMDRAGRIQNELLPKVLGELARLEKSVGVLRLAVNRQADPAAVAGALVAPLASAIVARLPKAALTVDDVKTALRDVLRAGVG